MSWASKRKRGARGAVPRSPGTRRRPQPAPGPSLPPGAPRFPRGLAWRVPGKGRVSPEGEQRGRVRRASGGERSEIHGIRGCLGRRFSPGTWTFVSPRSLPPACAPRPLFLDNTPPRHRQKLLSGRSRSTAPPPTGGGAGRGGGPGGILGRSPGGEAASSSWPRPPRGGARGGPQGGGRRRGAPRAGPPPREAARVARPSRRPRGRGPGGRPDAPSGPGRGRRGVTPGPARARRGECWRPGARP